VHTHRKTGRLARFGGVGALLAGTMLWAVPALSAPAMALTVAAARPAPQSVTAPSSSATGGMAAAQYAMDAAAVAPASLAGDIAAARMATVKYATNLGKAKADGYRALTMMMPGMGFHFLNPKVQGFDVRKPPILVYEHTSSGWQLGALEWVFTSMPADPPLPDATFGSFPAACHYNDGTFIPEPSAANCPKKAPHTGAPFFFWHPRLVTMHVWVWYPNPSGMYASTNPLVAPFTGS
jgi:hypothetical protein